MCTIRWKRLAVWLWIGATPAMGQYYIQQGNYLDANNRLGSGGLNFGTRDYAGQINSGNRLISGNVAGGQTFRGFSTIRDSSAFYLGTPTTGGNIAGAGLLGGGGGYLPSDTLFSFNRDSVNPSELRRAAGVSSLAPSPYYAPGSTVTNTGQIINRLNAPGTSQVRNPYESLRLDQRTPQQNPLDVARKSGMLGNPLLVEPRLARSADALRSGTGQVNERLLGSALFGGTRQVPISQVAAQAGMSPTVSGQYTRTATGEVSATPQGSRLMKPEPGGSPLDRLLGTGQPGGQPGDMEPMDSAGTPQTLAQPSEFGTLAARTGPMPGAQQDDQRMFAGPAVEQAPLPTFVGTPDQRLNEQLALGEDMLKKGRYYDAARRYEVAHAIQMENPLPLFGRAMALLAAGDYVSSANDLFAAIQFAGAAGAPRVELKSFVTDLSVLDQRRAFLEQRLEMVDDFRLRFLLGWTEYMSGMPEPGIANMSKALKTAPQMKGVQEYVDALAQQVHKANHTPATKPN